jgi:hypothetical protein
MLHTFSKDFKTIERSGETALGKLAQFDFPLFVFGGALNETKRTTPRLLALLRTLSPSQQVR